MHNYKMVQVPPAINVGSKEKGNEAASYLQEVVNQQAKDGWEFFRIDSIGIATSPGCLSALAGGKNILNTYYVITFKK